MKNAIRFLIAAFFAWSAPAFAADNTLIVTPGIGVTTRSKDIGAGLQLPYVGIADGSGNELGLTGNPFFIGFGTGVTLPAFASPPAVSLNTTPSLANGNGVVPTQGGNVLSATNGIFANVLQGNAVLSATNGLFSNLLQGNAVLSTSNPIFVTGTGTAGSAATNPITVQGISGGTNLPVILNAETTKVIGEVNQGTSPWVVSNGGTFAVQATLQASGSTAIGKVDPNTPANWGIGATGSAVPANAQYIGIISGGNLTGWTGAVTVGSGGIASGAVASGAIASGAVASGAIASGAYASGSVSDGAVVTLGAKADAKSTATDTTAITLMQVGKEISFAAQNPMTASAINPTSTLTLPSTTTAYTAGTLICTSATVATCNTALGSQFLTISNSAGAAIISRLRLTSNDSTSTAWGTQTIQIDLWSAAPQFATTGDRGSFTTDFSTGTAGHLGSFTCVMSAVLADGVYSECSPSVGNFALLKLASGTSIFWTAQAVTGSGVTGASKVFTLTAEMLN